MTTKPVPIDESGESKQSLGGRARAKKLSPAERSEISRKAAEARWAGGSIPKETHSGILKIGAQELPCSVLDNGLRVFSMNGLSRAFGSRKKGRDGGKAGTPGLPPFLATQSIRQFIPEELAAPLLDPIFYKAKYGGMTAKGYPATVLPQICEVIIDAAKGGGFYRASEEHVAAIRERAERFLRGFARVGVIALVDEATGYQEDRAKDELLRILEAYVQEELRPWTRMFPEEFFKQTYKLLNWEYKPGVAKRNSNIGKWINKYIYDRLPPGVLPELQRLNPRPTNGYRKHRHFQFLTAETGNVHLDKQITVVTTIMKISDDREDFERNFAKAFPKQGDQIRLPLVVEVISTKEE